MAPGKKARGFREWIVIMKMKVKRGDTKRKSPKEHRFPGIQEKRDYGVEQKGAERQAPQEKLPPLEPRQAE